MEMMRSPAAIFFEEFHQACHRGSRNLKDVKVLPVSKGRSVEQIRDCLREQWFPKKLSENYLEELKEKQHGISNEFSEVEWHFSGRLQSRKLEEICSRVAFVHTVSRVKEILAISKLKTPPKFFIQINISEEPQKNGFSASELNEAIEAVDMLRLRPFFVGLMGMASLRKISGDSKVLKQFELLRRLRDSFLPNGELSMGMSDDYELALKEGATLIRIGSRLFEQS